MNSYSISDCIIPWKNLIQPESQTHGERNEKPKQITPRMLYQVGCILYSIHQQICLCFSSSSPMNQPNNSDVLQQFCQHYISLVETWDTMISSLVGFTSSPIHTNLVLKNLWNPYVHLLLQSFQHFHQPDEEEEEEEERLLFKIEKIQEAIQAMNGCVLHCPFACTFLFDYYDPENIRHDFPNHNSDLHSSSHGNVAGGVLLPTLIHFYYFILFLQYPEKIQKQQRECIRNDILLCISHLFVHGFLLPLSTEYSMDMEERYQKVLETVQYFSSFHFLLPSSSSSSRSSIYRPLPKGYNYDPETMGFLWGDIQEWESRVQIQPTETDYHAPLEWKKIIQRLPAFQTISIQEAICRVFPQDTIQRQYLLDSIASSPTSSTFFSSQTINPSISTLTTTTTVPATTTRSHLDSTTVVDQIHSIVPNLGKGYIEAALACYQHNVEMTISALVECQINPQSTLLHPRLRNLDPMLPLNSHHEEHLQKKQQQEEKEAKDVQKERIRTMHLKMEQEAYDLSKIMTQGKNTTSTKTTTTSITTTTAPNINVYENYEYNDDYDDQYDGIGEDGGATGGVGGADHGLYDDFDAVRTYNRIVRDIEQDQSFWDMNRNLNRLSGPSKSSREGNAKEEEVDDKDGKEEVQKTFRGPDKGKGGRILGPDGKYLPRNQHQSRVSKVESGQTQTSTAAAAASNATTQKVGKSQQIQEKQPTSQGKNGSEEVKVSPDIAMTKLQKRHKNDNRAKIANHHRKDRATKKSQGGMI